MSLRSECPECGWLNLPGRNIHHSECSRKYKPAPSAVEAKGEHWSDAAKVVDASTPEKHDAYFAEPNAREWYLKTESEKFGEGPNPFREGYPSEVIPYIMDTTYAMPKRSTPEDIHVIEHSAYQKLERELAELRKELDTITPNSLRSFDVAVPSDEWYDTIKERDALSAKVAGLCSALREIENNQESEWCSVAASEALKRFGEGK